MLECQDELRVLRRETMEKSELELEREAQRILVTAMQRLANKPNNDFTATIVQLPSEEIKGRIIGREGRNIRTLEQATGVDIIIDDTPEAVTISGFDMARREVARMALEQLDLPVLCRESTAATEPLSTRRLFHQICGSPIRASRAIRGPAHAPRTYHPKCAN